MPCVGAHPNTVVRTRLQAVDGECGLSQEVLVTEHVDLIHHKAQEGEGGVAHVELERLAGPRGVQAVVSWRRRRRCCSYCNQEILPQMTMKPEPSQNCGPVNNNSPFI